MQEMNARKPKKQMSVEGAITRLGELAKHSLYCRWVREGGFYDNQSKCTCGRDEALAKLWEDFSQSALEGRNENSLS